VVPIEHNVANATKYATNSMNEKKTRNGRGHAERKVGSKKLSVT